MFTYEAIIYLFFPSMYVFFFLFIVMIYLFIIYHLVFLIYCDLHVNVSSIFAQKSYDKTLSCRYPQCRILILYRCPEKKSSELDSGPVNNNN